jgi:hypothetical protein
MKLNIEITTDYINLFDANSQIIYNQTPLSELNRTTNINNIFHSYWIEKYYNHIFIRIKHLYKLAQFINQEYPDNRIDWFSQFYKIEFYQKLLDIEYDKTDNSEIFNRSLFEENQSYIYASANALSKDEVEIAKIKGEVLTQLTNYDLI